MRGEEMLYAMSYMAPAFVEKAENPPKSKTIFIWIGSLAAVLAVIIAVAVNPLIQNADKGFYVNQIAMVITNAPPYFDPENHYTESRNNAGIAEYLGVDLSDIGDQYKYIGNENHTLTFRNDGTLVDDVVGFAYSSADGESTVGITVSKLKMPSGDICFPFEEERSTRMTSKNGEIDVVFYADVGGINPTEKQDRVTASFKLGDVYYRVAVINCFAQEAYQVVSDILMK